ncbi:MAG: hypothetical protein AB1374_00350 [Bacillota bacterium]
MIWQGLRIKAVLVALAIGLICLFGGQWLYEKYGYQQSLQQALGQQPQVADFAAEEQNGRLVVTIRLRSPDNLMPTYKKLESLVGEALGSRPFVIEIADSRDAGLEEVLYRSQFAVYQALVQGSFKEMEAEVSANAREAGAETRIYIDNDNVYLTFKKEDRFLAAVIPRNPAPKATEGGSPYA